VRLEFERHQSQVLLIAVLLLASSCHGAASSAKPQAFTCPSEPKLGVYNPDRLKVLTPCVWFSGTVVASDSRSDGDQHLLLTPDSGYAKYLNVANVNEGGLVVEIMPGQQLPFPTVNEHVAVFGTWVFDTHNGWNEIHPVWGIRYLDSGRSIFALPPATPQYQGSSND
jgi:hypothetical protein